MLSVRRRLFVSVSIIVLALPLALYAQDPCNNVNQATKDADYTLSAANGTPVPANTDKDFHYTLKNNSDVLIRLQDINPYSFSCTVTTSTTAVQETAVSSFLGLLGGVSNVGATTPNAATPAAPAAAAAAAVPAVGAAAAPSCSAQYTPTSNRVRSLQAFRDRINDALRQTQTNQDDKLLEFSRRVAALRSQSKCTDVVDQANHIVTMHLFDILDVPVPDRDRIDSDPRTDPQSPLPQAIDELSRRAQFLFQHLTDDLKSDAHGDCKKQLQSTIDQDSAFLSALINSTTSTPSAVTTWANQLNAFNTVRNNLASAKSGIVQVLGNRANFNIDTRQSGGGYLYGHLYSGRCSRNSRYQCRGRTCACYGGIGNSRSHARKYLVARFQIRRRPPLRTRWRISYLPAAADHLFHHGQPGRGCRRFHRAGKSHHPAAELKHSYSSDRHAACPLLGPHSPYQRQKIRYGFAKRKIPYGLRLAKTCPLGP
jgi:hypothetical protein